MVDDPARGRKRFKKVYIEITTRCNLSCSFCPGSDRKPDFMSLAAFSHAAGAVAPYTDTVYLHVMGEPLLHPELARILEVCSSKALAARITTNGSLLAKSGKILLESPAVKHINISLHSHSGAEEGLEEYLRQVLDFSSQASALGTCIVSLRLWNFEAGKSDPDNLGIARAIASRYDVPDIVSALSSAYAGLRLGPRLFLNCAERFSWPEPTAPDLGAQGFCHGLGDQIAILSNGTVLPCCLDSRGLLALGNIEQEELSKILEGARAQAIIKGFRERKAVEGLCRRCAYKERFARRKAP